VIWKEIGAPALTVEGFGTESFWTLMFGQLTTIFVELLAVPSFEVVTPAVLLISPQVAMVVGEVRWTFLVASFARLPQLQVS
jgi:hypothetical protein